LIFAPAAGPVQDATFTSSLRFAGRRSFLELLVGLVALRFRVLNLLPQSDELLGKWFFLRRTSVKYLNANLHAGVPMPRYLTQHTLACLTRQGAEALAQRMRAGGTAHAERVLVNMLEGKMFVEFRADSREALEGWLKTEGMHFDFLVRIEWEMRGDKLEPAE
jgi:hypothetical protein